MGLKSSKPIDDYAAHTCTRRIQKDDVRLPNVTRLVLQPCLDGHLFVAEIEDIVRAGVLHAMGGGDPIPLDSDYRIKSRSQREGKKAGPGVQLDRKSATQLADYGLDKPADQEAIGLKERPDTKSVSEIADLLMRRAEGIDIGSAVILSSRRSDNQPFIACYQVDTCRISRDQA